MEHKPIYLDGINVSKCDFYDRDKKYCLTLKMYPKGFKNPSCFSGDFQQCIQDSKTCPNTFCHNNPNCYFKQLARKTQECEELKDKIKKLRKNLALEIEINDRYRKALEEIEEYLDAQQKYFDGEDYHNLLDIINKAKEE